MARKPKRRAFGTIMTDRRRPGRFYVRFVWTDGRLIKRYGGPSRQIAAERLSTVHALKARGAALEEVLATAFGETTGASLSFRDAAPKYLEYAENRKQSSTIKRDKSRLRIACAAPWAGKYLGAVRPDDIARWAQAREKAGISGSTLNKDLNIVSALYKWAVLMEYAEDNPASSKRMPRYPGTARDRDAWLTGAEARALIDAAEQPFRPLVMTALHTGMRKGELLAMAWRDVDFNRREISVRTATEKTKRGRTIPMTAELADTLLDLRERRKVLSAGSVFAMPDGSPILPDRADGMLERTLAACEAIPKEKKEKPAEAKGKGKGKVRYNITFHTLRHTAASLMVQAGVNLMEVMRLFGWTSMQMVMRYAHLAPGTGRVAVDALGNALQGAPAAPAEKSTGA